ncbi:D-TA family PLP-dependent enzyme [Myxococcaceae bacterium JPH2]|nr:D-TA family PLP-dependent enzyme [Myxococcaceae bacterium JPH2]
MPTPSLAELDTPAAVVDLDLVKANLQRVAAYTREHGLRWRPHTKTHKTPQLTALQLEAGADGITVATVREAEVMSTVARDVLLAYPPVGEATLARLMALPPEVRLSVALDSREVLAGLSRAARASGRPVSVLVELDMGMRRVGVASPEEAVSLAQAVREAPGVTLRGLIFYPGHLRAPQDELRPLLREQSIRLSAFIEALRAQGLAPEVVSGGSTPTLWRSHEVAGLTEIRPGINIFNDRNSASVGACDLSECAYSVLATVVSTAVPGQAVIDAGSKALAKEEGPAPGYGVVREHPEVGVRSLSEEHGLLDLSATPWRPRVGERVRVIPNHVCASVNLHARLHVLEGGQPVATWDVAARGW